MIRSRRYPKLLPTTDFLPVSYPEISTSRSPPNSGIIHTVHKCRQQHWSLADFQKSHLNLMWKGPVVCAHFLLTVRLIGVWKRPVYISVTGTRIKLAETSSCTAKLAHNLTLILQANENGNFSILGSSSTFNCVTLYSGFFGSALCRFFRDAEFSHSFSLRQLKLNPVRDVCSLKIAKWHLDNCVFELEIPVAVKFQKTEGNRKFWSAG